MRLSGGTRQVLVTFVAVGLVLGSGTAAAAAGPPALTSVSPVPAPVGATVSIAGSGLAATTSLSFAGVAATYSVASDGQLMATVPAGAVDGALVVTTPDGSATLPFDVDEPPAAVSGLVAHPGNGAVRLRWTLPAADVAEVVVRRAIGASAPATPADGVPVPVPGVLREVVDSDLTNGTTYSYAVWTRDSAGSLSPAAAVSTVPAPPGATELRIGLSAATVTSGTFVAVTGVLARSGSGAEPIAGSAVTLLTRPRGAAAFVGTATATTDALGAVAFSFRVLRHTDLLLRHTGDAFSGEALSLVAPVSARHGLTSRLVPSVVQLGGTAVLEGRAGPAAAGVPVRLERLAGSAWQLVATTVTDSAGGFRHAIRPSAGGEQVLRAVTVAGAGHLAATGVSLRLVTLARTLSSGMSGADVLALERRLTDLRYDVGPISGTYDYDTRLAVMAFQKVHFLPRTGVADLATRARLGTPTTPRLRNPVAGLSVEVDLARQVLLFGRNGVVIRILPVSSGNNALYTVDGITSRAVTPVGRFRVTRKIDGVRVSRLGQLYQPAYFVGGYAIHGSPSVPGFPASHGCIRITIPAMQRLFPLLPVGTPVLVYRS